MSNRKSSRGCLPKFLLAVLIVGILFALLYFTGAFRSIRISIEKYIYPLKYEAEIMKASEKYDLEPEFIAAVIYTESKFKENSESSAGAKGLMQLMPNTFMWLVEKRGDSYTESDIMTPEVNIDYGCYYLSWLDKYLPGDIYTATAAYNAGMGRVSEWLENPRYSVDGENLVTMPFTETENYVNEIKHKEQKYSELYFSK